MKIKNQNKEDRLTMPIPIKKKLIIKIRTFIP